MTANDTPTTPDTIVLIHGLWMTPLSWERWVDRYSSRGYTVHAPSWPGMEGDIEELRRDPSSVAGLGVTEIVDHYDKFIRSLDRPPIIMGHSFGGLVTQILLDRGLGAAGVAIDSAPVKGILVLPFSTLKVSFPALRNPANLHRAMALTPEQFHDDRAPLLLIAGKDHIAPASVTEANFRLYRKSKAVTDYKEFPDRSHYTLGEAGWEQVADYALRWAVEHAAPDGHRPSPNSAATNA